MRRGRVMAILVAAVMVLGVLTGPGLPGSAAAGRGAPPEAGGPAAGGDRVAPAMGGGDVAAEASGGAGHEVAPPNVDRLVDVLVERGAIPPGADDNQVREAVASYLRSKVGTMAGGAEDKKAWHRQYGTRYRWKEGLASEALLSGRGKKFGQVKDNVVDPVVEQPRPDPAKTVKILVLLVEFGGEGPLHNQIPQPEGLAARENYWTADFSPEHYAGLLFNPDGYTTPEGVSSHSLTSYYLEQSNGGLLIEGDVYGWFQVPNPEWYYGRDNPEGGVDNGGPADPRDLVREVASLAVQAGVNLAEYDYEDPYDLDRDGDLMEPDGIVDHLMVIHAGVGQEAGGGAQGDDAIWSHSWSLQRPYLADPSHGGGPYWSGTAVYDYTMEPEDGALGVFAHEFAHDLGLPDEYDTIYSGDGEPVEYWSLMSGGSWTGKPLGARPTSISPWGRIMLRLLHGGTWVQPTVVQWADLAPEVAPQGLTFLLDQATSLGQNNQVVRVNLPPKRVDMNVPHSGSYEFWGGQGDEIDHHITTVIDLTGKSSAILDFWTWYEIEENWDFGFVQVSTDGEYWTSLATSHTTYDIDPDGYPAIRANLPGYTGSSGGWLHETIDLSAYCGTPLYLRFRYMTDWAFNETGFFVDDITVTADGEVVFSDDAESGLGQWENAGWVWSPGYRLGGHYYLLEWRNWHGSDVGLREAARANLPYNPGLVIWYRDLSVDNNWVGVHPGQVFLGVVDAHQYVWRDTGLPNAFAPFIQLYDASFGLNDPLDLDLSRYAWVKRPQFEGKRAQPLFDDRDDYWTWKTPCSGIKLPTYGLKVRVVGDAPDLSVGAITIYR
ncbi:MAG: immune inhibitor A [Firmicutes bacterium]|nr:immune inhibitor A [Bacillota bacterium]